jgi:gliding motility-associated-like protein
MVPDFSASATSGCAPLYVAFKDLTTGNPKFWNWDFSNGTLSNIQNPGVTFDQPGTYTVKLVVRNADGTTGITKTDYITVYPSPSASFTSNITTGCIPVNIQFTDRSTTPVGNISSWQWDFGDGAKSTAQNPTHNYTSIGFYTVTLTVTSNTGCKSTASYGRYIRIVSGVKAEFDNSKPASCQAPYTINFLNQSSGPGNMTFQWDLGNGTTSTQKAPSTTYAEGTYNVTLTATSDFGCSGTITKPVTLTGPSTSIQAPDMVCQDVNISFINNSSVTPQKTLWDFGNGQQSTSTNGSAVYLMPGDYTVKLYNNYSTCKDSAIKSVHVNENPVVDFNVTNAAACKPPLNVTFQDASSSTIVNWVWHFGDGSSGTGSPVTHQYNSADNFNVSVDFTDDKGCVGHLTKPAVIQIIPPTVKITSGEAGGCVPFTYTPTANVTSVDGIATYSWDFGDGTVVTSTNPSPPHIYTQTGKYAVKLTITTNGGCSATDIATDGVQVGTPPTASFTVSNTDACASEMIKFTDQSTPSTDVNGWGWDFDDGSSSKQQNPTHIFLDSGTFIVKLIAFNNRCPSTTFNVPIHIKPPIAWFRPILTCGSLTVSFKDSSSVDPSKPVSYSWTISGGIPGNSIAQNPTSTFPAFNQDYPVTLTVTQDGCTSTHTETVKMVKELADFSVNASVCKNANFNITSTNTPKNISKYEWSIDGSPYSAGGATYVANFSTNGSHSIGLTITDINGCTDNKTGTVTVVSPTAKFTATSPGGCKNAIITFNDQSSASSAGSALTKWTVDFKDGKTESFTSAPFSHTFTDTGEYVPHLTVEDAMGCIDTISLADTIFISTPQPWFTSDIIRVCPKSDVHFADSSFGKALTYLWNFGNGSTSVDKDPVFSYGGDNATYSVKLVITDRSGCKDSVTRTNYITAIKPIPAFDIEDTLTICPPIETKFTFQGQNYDSLEWDFGDGATSTLLNPTHFYNSYGDFTAKLYLYGYGGCKDSTSKNVHVLNPGNNTTFTYSPLDACNELLVDFSLVAIPNIKFALYFGDGTLDSSMATTYKHFYKSPAFYSPAVQYTDNQGCIAGVGGPPIKVIGADPFFGVDRKKFCDSGIVYFTNYTIGNDPVVTRTWNFGDGSATSSVTDPVHYYQQPGLYSVSQSVTTQQGCSKTISDTIRVYRTPDPYITGDSIACLNTTMNLQANVMVPDTAITWKWDLGNNNSSTAEHVSLTFKNSGTYTVKLQASNPLGCGDTTSKDLYVPPTPVLTVIENPVIPVSTGITLPVTYGPEVVSYNWTPVKNLSCIDCPTPYANPKSTTTYMVKVTDQYGCTNKSAITVTVVCSGLNYFIPNTFSPNGDGVNDIFAPRGIGLARVNSMRIFNRWGEMVFEKMNFMANDRTPTGGWDGTYKGKPASADVYVYIIEFVCENNAIVPVKGNVALVR